MSDIITDIVREIRAWTVDTDGLAPEEVSLNVSAFADRIEVAIRSMRSQLYGLAASIRSITGRSDARERGVHYSEVQNIAAQIENIADNGGRV